MRLDHRLSVAFEGKDITTFSVGDVDIRVLTKGEDVDRTDPF